MQVENGFVVHSSPSIYYGRLNVEMYPMAEVCWLLDASPEELEHINEDDYCCSGKSVIEFIQDNLSSNNFLVMASEMQV